MTALGSGTNGFRSLQMIGIAAGLLALVLSPTILMYSRIAVLESQHSELNRRIDDLSQRISDVGQRVDSTGSMVAIELRSNMDALVLKLQLLEAELKKVQ